MRTLKQQRKFAATARVLHALRGNAVETPDEAMDRLLREFFGRTK